MVAVREEVWYRGDGADCKAKAAFEALLGVQLYWPSTEVFDTFSKKLKQRTLDDYDYDYGNDSVRRAKLNVYHCIFISFQICQLARGDFRIGKSTTFITLMVYTLSTRSS